MGNKTEWTYEIMHLEQPVAEISSDGLCRIAAPSFLPYNLYLQEEDDISVRIDNLSNFYYWCASRVLTLDRVYAKEVLNAIGATQSATDKDRAKISLSYHCVTLTDVFWVRQKNEEVSFDKLNLYTHSLSDAFVDVSLLGRNLTVENAELLKPQDTAGDVSTQGAVPKAWIKRDGHFILLKDGENVLQLIEYTLYNGNLYGTSIAYRGHSYKSDVGFDFSLSFEDTPQLEVYTLAKTYDEYHRLPDWKHRSPLGKLGVLDRQQY